MSITAIVPVWNGRELLERLLASLEAQTEAAAELLVVDNGSTDGAPELARAHGARVIPMGRNAGFAAAVNRGIRDSRGEWIAVLNSDVELAPDYFAKLLAACSADAWFATGKILAAASDHRIDATFDLLCRGGAAWRVGNGRADGPASSLARPIWSAPWTAALFRAELFQRVGLLEESFESYLEDVEFGLRSAARGFAGHYVPEALAWHRGSATLGRWHPETVRRMARNQLLLLARHYPRQLLLGWFWPIFVAQFLWGAVAVRHGAGFAWLRGEWQGLRGFFAARGQTLDATVLESILRTNERLIRSIQVSTGFDIFWKLYFLLTRGGAK
ncbi:MAG: glycosyltransferase family 2 protein [Bryobacteraceae bacterium]